ncbi:unnamed protein product [Lymnaea stagnalis]|uniref:Angiotensin-converting enzyme n=1 Tax=Lymnaea stagnalis TaxID=6523 RepID=A0AAV2HFU2_LYMST
MSYLATTVILTCLASLSGVFCDGDNANVTQAREFLERYGTEGSTVKYSAAEAEYQHKTNITTENEHKLLEQQLKEAEFDKNMRNESLRFNITAMPGDVARQLNFIKDIGTSAEPDEAKFKAMKTLQTGMETIYGKAKVCLRGPGCLELEPGLTDLLATSRDYDTLLEAWKGWRDATGPKMKDSYVKYVDAVNEAIRITGYNDLGEYWRSSYETPTFEEDVANLFAQVRPLYEQLHGYVRRKLKGVYGADKFPASGHIPAHLLGNMWAQEWNNIVKDVSPYPNKKSLDVTDEMVKQGYNATRMFRTAEAFFVSLGFDPMVPTFWTKSMLVKPDDRDVVCHASAWDFKTGEDFRIKMCTVITHQDLMTIHHEMGHVEYYMQYKNQSLVYREGANPGFHEAVGDLMTLSVQTPRHLKKLNLLDEVPDDPETDLNFLMNIALQKVAFLPFGYLIDQWRWSVFRGNTKPDDYNKDWWDLRCRFQGLSSPVPRSTSDFDPGAKYHVAGDVPYIRYFVSFIIQFQFHKAACNDSGHVGPLHTCDIYNNKAAGARIRQMLQLGSSRPWQDAMEVLTGQRNMDATALLEYFHPLLEFLKKENGNDYGWDPQCPELEPETVTTSTGKSCDSVGDTAVSSNITEAEEFLRAYDEEAERVLSAVSEAEYNSETNITDYNDNLYVQTQVDKAEFDVRRLREALNFNTTAMPGAIARQLTLIKNIGPSAEPNTTKVTLLKKVQTEMESIYGKAKPCLTPKECLSLEPDLTRLMATSRDYDRLLAAWQGWRDETGRKMKPLYKNYVQLFNEAVKASCYNDAGEYWRSWYETPTFEEDVANLFAQVRPLYEQLHGYVRSKLKGVYGADKFPASGHIPAHLLGNMWAQEWNSIFDLVEPFKGKVSVDVTNELVRQNYTVDDMFKTAEDFYVSIGFPKMVPDFWNKSMLEKPNDPGREVVCHGSATDFYTGDDFRIKMCTDITQEDLMTIHHEMGHIEYFMAYKDQPVVFRDGANPGFHEAIGDVMTLSVQTPKHLRTIGLLSQEPTDNETDINFLMMMALQKVAFLPFGYLIDQWRWSVFRGDTKPDDYNDDWWDLRCRYQGISSPVPRTAFDFDPGAKYHVPADVAYIRYFVSFIIQFQFQKAACEAAGHVGPLHKCDIYNNKAAGKLIRDMLRLGRSKPWPDAMEAVTGQRKMDATALLDYFRPLLDFLRQKNGNDFGWDPHCPAAAAETKSVTTPKTCGKASSSGPSLFTIIVLLVILLLS